MGHNVWIIGFESGPKLIELRARYCPNVAYVSLLYFFFKTDNPRMSTGKIDECGGSCVLKVDPIANGTYSTNRIRKTQIKYLNSQNLM